jgi:hypothetical protein
MISRCIPNSLVSFDMQLDRGKVQININFKIESIVKILLDKILQKKLLLVSTTLIGLRAQS